MLDRNTLSMTHTVTPGDTWSRIATKHRPEGTSPHLYLEYIQLLNGGKLTNGRTILV
jgi:hypothetical protein